MDNVPVRSGPLGYKSRELLALVRPKTDKDDEDKTPPSAAELLDRIKASLDHSV